MDAHRHGATFFELLIALSLISVLLSVALPHMRTALDALAARAAREAAFGLFSRARIIALQQGGSEIELDAAHDVILIRAPNGVIEHEQYFPNIDLRIDGVTAPVVLRYDGHGLGRVMSRTLRFQAGSAVAGLTVSSFGRVRRW
jgi:Tfp pilus assembly protein FimT